MRISMITVIAACLTVAFFSPQRSISATNHFIVGNSSFSAYIINGENNPDLTLVRGFMYAFDIDTPGHPFWVKTVQGTGSGNSYGNGITNNGTTSGILHFDVPPDAPDLLYYNCQFHALMTGQFNIIDPPDILITQLSLSTNLTVASTGTDALNIQLQARTNLTEGTWLPLAITGNLYADGTNTTQALLPTDHPLYLRIRQGFF